MPGPAATTALGRSMTAGPEAEMALSRSMAGLTAAPTFALFLDHTHCNSGLDLMTSVPGWPS